MIIELLLAVSNKASKVGIEFLANTSAIVLTIILYYQIPMANVSKHQWTIIKRMIIWSVNYYHAEKIDQWGFA